MLRRDFGKASFGILASSALSASSRTAEPSGNDFPKTPVLTAYVARFVAATTYEQIPDEVIELGKKSILDGLGLALAGSRAETGSISRKYVQQIGVRSE